MGGFARFPYDEQSHLEVMDTIVFRGVNAGLLILLTFWSCICQSQDQGRP